ncbi:MAG TPA: phosphotransferase [Acidimicrobiales bacterium]|nr:phosphotransferase [Acidimicrobiales bacterium]
MLGSDERRAAERILAEAWGEAVAVRAAEVVAGRRHVVRLSADDGRTAILKRSRATDSGGGRWGDEPAGLASEWTALDLLGAMPEPVAPRLLGGDATRRLIVIEDLPPGRLLAHSLLGSDPVTARADLVAYAEALAAVGAGSRDRAAEHAAACRRRGLDPGGGSWWVRVIGRRREGFLAFAADLGLPTAGADAEIAEIEQILDGEIAPGFVHGDPCPDNIVLIDGRCCLLDFERSSWGSVVLDAAYLIAPFPSCWCFAGLPAEAVGPALAAYHASLAAAGQEPAHGPGRDWDRAVAAALAGGSSRAATPSHGCGARTVATCGAPRPCGPACGPGWRASSPHRGPPPSRRWPASLAYWPSRPVRRGQTSQSPPTRRSPGPELARSSRRPAGTVPDRMIS